MQNAIARREFLKTAGRTGLACAGVGFLGNPLPAIEPFKRTGAPRLLLSCAAYSFRDYFVHGGSKKAPASGQAKRIELTDFIDFCAANGCDGTELTSYYFPPDAKDDYLINLRRYAFLRGIEISGTSVGNTFTQPPGPERDKQVALVKKWIDNAALLGAPHIRIFAGAAGKQPRAEAVKHCVAATEECCEYAGKKGVFLGLENHGGIVAEPGELMEIVRAVNSPWFGLNLDTGNFQTEDPYRDLAACAPYAVNVQIKAEVRRRGAARAEPADLPRLIKMLRDSGYQGYVALEYESAEDPWQAAPKLLKEMKQLMA